MEYAARRSKLLVAMDLDVSSEAASGGCGVWLMWRLAYNERDAAEGGTRGTPSKGKARVCATRALTCTFYATLRSARRA